MDKTDLKEFERIKVEDTKIVDKSKIKDVSDDGIDDGVLSNLTIDQLTYMLEYEDHSPEIVERIKYYIKLKK
ncbi:MAG: hypothetical protein IJP83_00470 [Mycoplasma sp.]|nr:hypothetical protein [Mycoplasma sp.]